ncbi:ribonuclease P protein subunit p38-like [Glandiceps talaboti]
MSGEKKRDYFTVKNSIESPYNIAWPRLREGDTLLILQEITRVFQPLESLLKKERSINRKKTEKRKLEEAAKDDKDGDKNDKKFKIRSQLCFGINEVTKALERSQLRLVIVCKSAKPALLTTHLIPLCVSRETPALCVSALSKTLAPILGLMSLLAIGFKTGSGEDDVFDELVKFVVSKAPPLELPWLQHKDVLQRKIELVKTDLLKQRQSQENDPSSKETLSKTQDGVATETDTSKNQSEPDTTGLSQTELDKTSFNNAALQKVADDTNKEEIEEPPSKRPRLKEVTKKKKKQKKEKKHRTEYQQLKVKQMKNIPNEKRQKRKKKRKAAKQK